MPSLRQQCEVLRRDAAQTKKTSKLDHGADKAANEPCLLTLRGGDTNNQRQWEQVVPADANRIDQTVPVPSDERPRYCNSAILLGSRTGYWLTNRLAPEARPRSFSAASCGLWYFLTLTKQQREQTSEPC